MKKLTADAIYLKDDAYNCLHIYLMRGGKLYRTTAIPYRPLHEAELEELHPPMSLPLYLKLNHLSRQSGQEARFLAIQYRLELAGGEE